MLCASDNSKVIVFEYKLIIWNGIAIPKDSETMSHAPENHEGGL